MTQDNDDKKDRDPGQDEYVVIDKRPNYDSGSEVPEPETRYPSFVEELKARAEEAEGRTREISAAYRRIDEERDAFRERLNRDLERRVDVARGDLIRKILGAVDDLERAVTVAGEMGDSSPMLAGVVLVRDRMLQILASEGVEVIETVGQLFDPEVAEALTVEPTTDPDRDNLVLEELQRGYSLGGTLLRPARVRVARLQTRDETATDETTPSVTHSPKEIRK